MAETASGEPSKSEQRDDRKARLAANLRANLRRRKSQSRALDAPETDIKPPTD